ncbi:MAG: histidinol-phosphatase [Rhizobiales bacterium]|nr:histidinol-phosphatase [Hyphomicrobiales bacterium]
MTRDFNDDLKLAHRLADGADAISLRWFKQLDQYDSKEDGSPVTLADLEIERHIRAFLETERPYDACLGEELSDHAKAFEMDSPTWIVDPIDHTRHFTRGDPNYGCLITLIVEGIARVAVVSAPSLGFRWVALQGAGAFQNRIRMSVSTVNDLNRTHLALAGHREWMNSARWERVSQLMDDVAYACGTEGGFLPAMKVASAQLDAFAEPWGKVWDHAALALIVQEAGGRTSTLKGSPPAGGSLLASNGLLHDQLLEYFESSGGNSL